MTYPRSAVRSPAALLPAAVLVPLMMLAGCSTLQDLMLESDTPTARIKRVKLDALDLNGAGLAFDVEVSNPYSFAVPLVNADYGLASGGAQFMTGEAVLSGTVPARGRKVVTLPARVDFASLLGAVSGVRPGAIVPYTVDLDLSLDAPGVGPINLPLSYDSELPVPTPPTVAVERIGWDKLSLDEATATLRMSILNENQFPVDLSRLDYRLALGGADVASSRVRKPVSFGAGQEQTVEIPFSFAPKDLGVAVFRMLTGDDASYDIGGTASFGSTYGKLDLPFSQSGRTMLSR